MLLDQWREASTLKLQRAAHEMDMHLARIKDGIRLVHEAAGTSYSDAYHQWALEHLSRHEGIQDVRLIWASAPGNGPPDAHPGRSRAPGHPGPNRRFHSGQIREITPPVFDAGGQHGTVNLISVLLDDQGRVLGRLEVTANFDYIFRGVVESGWWQSSKAFLVDRSGAVLVCTVPGRHAALAETDDPLENAIYRAMQSAPSGTVMGPGHPPAEVGGFFHLHEAPWVLVMVAPGDEVLAPIVRFRWGFALYVLAIIAVIVALIRFATAGTVADIRRVSNEALRLSRGEFGDPLPVAGRDEVSELTRSFNRMTRQLRERLALKRDMGLAMEVQQNLLPSGPPAIPGLDIAGRSVYCQETGGDYFDYIPLADPAGGLRLCAAVGDVVGHGISAALLMTTVRALLRGRLDRPGGMAERVGDINRLLCRDTGVSDSFVTLFLLEVDPVAGRLEWVRAGHDPGLLYRGRPTPARSWAAPGWRSGWMRPSATPTGAGGVCRRRHRADRDRRGVGDPEPGRGDVRQGEGVGYRAGPPRPAGRAHRAGGSRGRSSGFAAGPSRRTTSRWSSSKPFRCRDPERGPQPGSCIGALFQPEHQQAAGRDHRRAEQLPHRQRAHDEAECASGSR